ncbi:uncharacterized protein LOC128550367 [Mercenaria mercenaria]|uniref:uncharacterized protein LOC128550367 n=1 Tax=Mercenaria mercenaria TaxID=6596 RepID=UPI00234ECC66|nr:uncharacterized protein LOC128550367 [Mercenaria mercenaria]
MEDIKQREEDIDFTILAKQIDSIIDPYFGTILKGIERLNMFIREIFGNEELIPVGSCIDGSKVSVPGDCGDMDVLMLSNKIILKEYLFDYDKAFPAFLHIRVNNEHQKYFQTVNDPIEGVYLPAAVLKVLLEKFSRFSKVLLMYDTQDVLSDDGKFLKVTRSTSVGKEQMQLYPFGQNAFDSSGKPDTLKFKLARIEKNAKFMLGGMINLPKQIERSHAEDESSSFDTNNRPSLTDYDNTSLLEMLNKILDIGEGKETDDGETRNIPDRNRDRQNDVTNDGKGNSMQGTTYLDKRDNKTPRDTFLAESLCANAYKKKIARDYPATKTKQNDSNSKLDVMNKNENFLSSDPGEVKESWSVGACIKKTTKYEKADEEMAFSKLRSIDFVPAFKFEGWPRVAVEWLTRSRKWPSKVILKNILESGCQVVAKRPLALYSKPVVEERDPYFRLSFALSEIILANSMKEQQLLCWRVLKAYQKCFLETKPKCLTSYHWKNVMFWVNEDLDESFWTNENVPVAVLKCLDFMTDCLQKRNLPFYFVRRMNLLNGCDETLFDVLREQVELIRREPLAFLKRFMSKPPKSETHFIDIEKVEDILSEETKAKNIDRNSEERINCIFYDLIYENFIKRHGEDKTAIQKIDNFCTHLLKIGRSVVDDTSSYDYKDVKDSNSLQAKMFLDTCEQLIESMKNGDEEAISVLYHDLFQKVLNTENGSDFEKRASQRLENFFSSVLPIRKISQENEGSSGNTSDSLSSLHEIVKLIQKEFESKYKACDESDGKDDRGANGIFSVVVSSFDKFIEGIQNSIKNEDKKFRPADEIKKIFNEASQKIGEMVGKEDKREKKTEMDIDLD